MSAKRDAEWDAGYNHEMRPSLMQSLNDKYAINPVLRQPKWRYVPGMYLVEGPGFDKCRIRITADDMAGLSEYDHESDIWIGPREISRFQAEDRLAGAVEQGGKTTWTA